MNAPKCAVHPETEMVLKEERAPVFIPVPDGCRNGAGPRGRRRTRKMWKCPEPSCYRVAVYAPTDTEEKKMSERDCPGCGEPTDADGVKRSRAMNLCSKCQRERVEERRQERENLRKAQEDLRAEYARRLQPEEATA